MITPKRMIGIAVGAFIVLGIWLIYWDVSDFVTTGLNSGIWDTSILSNGINSIVAGLVIVFLGLRFGYKTLF